jgi:signal transduction histidine kinase
MSLSPNVADRAASILIVDDEDQHRHLIERMLMSEGFHLLSASSGEEALAMVAHEPPDLILLDVMMPVMDGYRVARALKGNPATTNIPIIMITALDDRDAKMLGLSAGAEDFLTKPVDRAEVCVRVRNLLRLKAYGEYYDKYSQTLEAEVALRTAELIQRTKTLEQQAAALTRQAALLEEGAHNLAQALERAEQANRAKDTLLMTVSHELRTPLTAILGWADLLEGRPDPALVQRGLQVIKRNALAQTRLVGDLLDTSNIETGKMRLTTRPTDLRLVLFNVLEVVRPAAEAKNISIVTTGDEAPAIVLGDHRRLQQIMWNLLSNAVKFTPDGGTVRVDSQTSETRVRLEVSDNGSGIDPGFLSRVSEQFSQADMSPTRRYGGLGLGLTLVRQLVEMHGGTVEALSAGPGQGATFVVEIPVHHGSAEPLDAAATTAELSSPEVTDLTGVCVLIVDDDADSRTTVAMILEEAGASTVLAESASTGLHCLLHHDVDVVVCEIAMPHRDGVAFIHDVRTLLDDVKRHVPAVALTALARDEDRQWILAAGFQRYASKPVSADHLVRSVAAATAA